jgi:Tfp pilus assembly protein PilV
MLRLLRIRKYGGASAGISLVELLITMLIASIAMTGMVVAYIDALNYWQKASAKMVLFSEGAAAMKIMEDKLCRAGQFNFPTGWNNPTTEVEAVVTTDGSNSKLVKFFYKSDDNTVRWNNLVGDIGQFNIRLLPMYKYIYRPGEKHYLNIESITFTPIDPKRPEHPTTLGYGVVKIELALSDAFEDTVTLKSVVFANNKETN